MNRLQRLLASAAALVPVTFAAHAGQLITNGGFETGDFTGWTTANQDILGSWFVSNSTSTPIEGFVTPGPASGSFYAVTDQSGGANFVVLLQSFTIPVGATKVTLTFDLLPENLDLPSLSCPTNPGQCDRVDILTAAATEFDTAAGVVENLYNAAPNDSSWISETFDLSGLGAGTYQLRFSELDNDFFNVMGVDNVSITASSSAVPEPVTLSLFGAGLAGAVTSQKERKRSSNRRTSEHNDGGQRAAVCF